MISSFEENAPVIDPNAFVHPSAVIIGKVEVAAHSSIWPSSVLRGDMGLIRIGEYTSVQDGSICHVTQDLSETIIGNRVTIGHRVILHGCVVEDDCLIGMGSILLDNCVIGRGSFIAAGTLITVGTQIPPNSMVMGFPGKVIRQVNDKEKQIIEGSSQIYADYAQRYLAFLNT